ncbi:MAG: tetratricopeptide repeat protein [Myxococcota bacterium]
MNAARIAILAIGIGMAGAAFLPPPAAAAEARISQLFEDANAANARGDHQRAIEVYRRILGAGVEDPDLHYNLATAHAHGGQYGRAILHFERALRLRPGDEGAERGLAAARKALGERRASGSGEAMGEAGPPFPEVLVRGVHEDTLAWTLLGLDILLFTLLFGLRFAPQGPARLALGVSAPLAGLLLVAAGLGLAVKTGALREGQPGIVLEENAVVRQGPDPRAAPRGKALEGQQVRVLHRHGRYVHVRLPDDREGWMSQTDVEAI